MFRLAGKDATTRLGRWATASRPMDMQKRIDFANSDNCCCGGASADDHYFVRVERNGERVFQASDSRGEARRPETQKGQKMASPRKNERWRKRVLKDDGEFTRLYTWLSRELRPDQVASRTWPLSELIAEGLLRMTTRLLPCILPEKGTCP